METKQIESSLASASCLSELKVMLAARGRHIETQEDSAEKIL